MCGTRRWIVAVITSVSLLLGGCFGARNTPTGTLVVSYPQTYTVRIDSHTKGTTNQPIKIPVGKHDIALVDQATIVWSGEVAIIGGQTVTVTPPPQEPHTPPQEPPTPPQEPPTPPQTPADLVAYTASLVADFVQRDAMPETLVPESKWLSYGKYGPPAAQYPPPVIPAEYDRLQWQRDRVVAVARKYIGKVPYQHKHIPSLGLDCSNFTAWVYNYGLGIKFTSAVAKQGETVGRKLGANELMLPGDLLFFQSDTGVITHAAVYIEPGYMIDESGDGVKMKRFPYGWTATAFAHARRVLE